MNYILHHSTEKATDEAVRLWALASTQYPIKHQPILDASMAAMIEVISSFALNARRAMEIIPVSQKFALSQPRWNWKPANGDEKVNDLRDALNRIVHAQQLEVCFVAAPANISVMSGGAVVIPFLQARTDRKSLACIDPFAVSHAFLYEVLPVLSASSHKPAPIPQRKH